MEPMTIDDYRVVKPWLRMILAIIYDLKFGNIEVAYTTSDVHLAEFEKAAGSLKRGA